MNGAAMMRSDCDHITGNDELRRFYRVHPELIEGRCYFAGRIVIARGGKRLAFWVQAERMGDR